MKKRRGLPPPNNGLAGRIASVRRGFGLSQGAFGDRLGVSRNTVVSYERGQVPRTAVLDRIVQAGGVTAEWLLHGTASERSASLRRDQGWQEAVELLRQVWPDAGRRAAVISVLKALRPFP
jgi:transcriptional regulator with XRE-family HTH domain